MSNFYPESYYLLLASSYSTMKTLNSEFYNVALDQLRYSLVWEDSSTLHAALSIEPTDHVLAITSAGCNVLNALLASPAQVTAIDLNPVQNQLLLLKAELIRHHEHATLRGLLGLDGPGGVATAWLAAAPALPAAMRDYWGPFFAAHPAGILTAGKLERYLTGFLPTLPAGLQQKLRQLVAFDTVAAQRDFFAAELESTDFEARFVTYFDEANLSQGRDPALFKYALESGGQTFYARLKKALGTKLMRDNFFFRFFFFGPLGLSETMLPPCYQAGHHARLRQQLPKLRVVIGEAVGYLTSAAGRTITKASLSNIFEYTSPEEFQRVSHGLFPAGGRPLRLVYWNLLQNQGDWGPDPLPLNGAASAQLSQDDACFFFRNVRVLDSRLVTVPAGILAAF